MPVIAVEGLTIDYQSRGDAAAPTILLIMGLGLPAAMWPDEFVDELLARGFRVVRFDNRDSGGSTSLQHSTPPRLGVAFARWLLRRPVHAPYRLEDMARDAVGVLDALEIAQAHAVGISMGGMIAQELAARWPERVLSLTSMMSTSGNPRLRIALGRPRALRVLMRRPPPADDIDAVVRHLLHVFRVIGSPAFPLDPGIMVPLFERVARRGLNPAGTARQLAAILASGDRRPLLRHITAPTLVIHGAADPLVPVAAGRDTAQNIPAAELRVIAGMGHDVPPQLRVALAAMIAEHCRDAARAGPGDAPTVPFDPA